MSRELFPYSLYARQCYLKGSLRKKQLMAYTGLFTGCSTEEATDNFFLEHFKVKSSKHLKLIFQSHISKFKIFHTLFYWLSI